MVKLLTRQTRRHSSSHSSLQDAGKWATQRRACVAMLISTIAFVTTTTAPAAWAATAYISDELTVPLRSGPSSGHRILHRGLPSGTQMEVLRADEAAGFTQIRTTRGTEGWVRTQYLVSQPIAKMRLAAAQRELAQTKQRLQRMQQQVRELTTSNANQASATASDKSQINKLQAELDELTRISEGAVQTHKDMLMLTESNTRLRDELDDLAEERDRLVSNKENQAILYGAGFVLLGLLAGVLIKSRPQRSAWS